MKKSVYLPLLFFLFIAVLAYSPRTGDEQRYISFYKQRLSRFRTEQSQLLSLIENAKSLSAENSRRIREQIVANRSSLKAIDFWLRYLEPVAYKKINGPLPVEWETEVFEKFEAPYKRLGAGLTLAEMYLDEGNNDRDSLASLIRQSLQATDVFLADSITRNLNNYHHFFLANRLFILNLAAIYTTGFECPDSSRVIPELLQNLEFTRELYQQYNLAFPATPLRNDYLDLFDKTIAFVKSQPAAYSSFDHFRLLQEMVNPLYALNQQMILGYNVRSRSLIDFSLNKYAATIFDKSLYRGQNAKGVYIGLDDPAALAELRETGRLLFYDPILSLNNKRSCASCHKPNEFFSDSTVRTHEDLERKTLLPRNTPSLVNTVQNHLVMWDGKHINLENQCRAVITNPAEMGGQEEEILKKVMSCEQYKSVFKKYLKATPEYNTVNLEHIASAIMLYYTQFSDYYSPFDHAMNKEATVTEDVKKGFNLFMSKAQCATCHFVPQFNGTKPPYVGAEFEVIGVPADTGFTQLSADKGRYTVNPAPETHSAFRTGTVRNAAVTKPYMHNGVFSSLEQVIDFYDAGGGAGRGLAVPNQTLSADSLHLSPLEKKYLVAFIRSLTEEIPLQQPPARLPVSKNRELNQRTIGGDY